MISIIMPVLNEAAIVQTALQAMLRQVGQYEIIVVDAGSHDDTCALAQRFPVQLVKMLAGRTPGIGSQINCGVERASGDILLFLHADVELPANAITDIEAVLADPSIVGGGFVPAFCCSEPNPERLALKLVEQAWQLRTRIFCWFAGDTAPFIRAEAFGRCGGYPAACFAPDWDFAGQLRRLGRLAVIRNPVRVDSRRHLYNGVLKTLLVTGSIELMYRIGADRNFLRDWYRRWLPREREGQGSKQRRQVYE